LREPFQGLQARQDPETFLKKCLQGAKSIKGKEELENNKKKRVK